MATSSITESFYCDDPKAANAIVRLLFSKEARDSWQSPKATGVVIGADFRNDAQRGRSVIASVASIAERFTHDNGAGIVAGAA